MREIGKLVLVLVLICSVSAGALSWVRGSLAERIEQQSDFYVRGPALERLFAQAPDELLGHKVTVDIDGVGYPVFYTVEDGAVTGLAVEAAGHGGYGGDIVIMIGVDRESGEMLGVEIVSHGETPGLGAQVEKAEFRAQWRSLPATQDVVLGGGIDAISGATYSSKAMVDGTNQVTALIRDHEAEILALIAEAGAAEVTP